MVCDICPRNCNIDRTQLTGLCGEKDEIRLARAALHFWEEPCISGKSGSGTIFFSGCNLRCIYCQNRKIASGLIGKTVTDERLIEICYELKEKGANNINFVTPTHYTEKIIKTIDTLKSKNFDLPFVWNTSGFEKPETIMKLKDRASIYLTDFKYLSPDLSKKYSNAYSYPEFAKKSLDIMVENSPDLIFKDGLLKKGVIIRHLILPGHVDASINVMSYLFSRYGNTVIYSIMNQYTPPSDIKLEYDNLNRKLTKYEYEKVVDHCLKLGIENAYIQDGETQKESFIPEFNYEGI